jgi:hypothetical protein
VSKLRPGDLQRMVLFPERLLGMPPIGDVEHEAHHALRSAFSVEEHATLRPQPVDGAVLVNHPVLGRDIAGFVRTLDRELYRRPVVGMDELLPAFIGSVERSRLEAVHRLELRRPAVFALASADVPIECHRACRRLRKVEHFLSRAQLGFGALALGDVAHQGRVQPPFAMLELAHTHLDREHAPVLAPVQRLESHSFALADALRNPGERRPVEARVELARVHADELFTAVAEARARLLVDIDHRRVVGVQEEPVRRMVDQRPKARLARPQVFLRLPELGDVLHDAELSHGSIGFVSGHVPLTVHHTHRAVGTHHAVLHVIARTPAQGGLARRGGLLAVLRMDEVHPAPVPLRQVEGLHAEDAAGLVGERYVAGRIVALPPADARDALRFLEPALAFAQAAEGDEAAQRVGEPMTNLLEKALLFLRPSAGARALVEPEQVSPVAFRMQRHKHLRADTEVLGNLGLHLTLVTRASRQGTTGIERGARHFRRVRGHGQVAPASGRARELRPRMFHDGAPGRRVGVAGIEEPRAVAGEDLERCAQHVARHPLEVVGSLHGAVDAVHRLEEPDVRPVLRLGALALSDVAADAPVAHEAPAFIEHRNPGNGNVARAAVGSWARELEIPEREMRVHCGAVPTPSVLVRLHIWDFPARLADLRAGRRRVGEAVGELLTGKAMLRVGLPVHVERELHESAEALVARAKRVLGAPPSRAEFAEQQAETDEDREGQHMIRRYGERIRGRDEPVAHCRYADQRSQQAGPAPAVPGAQHDGGKRKLVDRGAFPERKYATQEQREAGQRQGKAIALERMSPLTRHVHRQVENLAVHQIPFPMRRSSGKNTPFIRTGMHPRLGA